MGQESKSTGAHIVDAVKLLQYVNPKLFARLQALAGRGKNASHVILQKAKESRQC